MDLDPYRDETTQSSASTDQSAENEVILELSMSVGETRTESASDCGNDTRNDHKNTLRSVNSSSADPFQTVTTFPDACIDLNRLDTSHESSSRSSVNTVVQSIHMTRGNERNHERPSTTHSARLRQRINREKMLRDRAKEMEIEERQKQREAQSITANDEQYRRFVSWQRERENRLENARLETIEEESMQQPQHHRGRHVSGSAHSSLLGVHSTLPTPDATMIETQRLPVEDRLFLLDQLSQQAQAHLREAVESVRAAQCTFKPTINEASAVMQQIEYLPVETRTTMSRIHASLRTHWSDHVPDECTFHPKTISKRRQTPDGCSDTSASLHNSVYERLYSTACSHPRSSQENAALRAVRTHLDAVSINGSDDFSCFLRNVLHTPKPLSVQVESKGLLDASQNRSMSYRRGTPVDSITQNFLRRQEFKSRVRAQNLDKLREETAPRGVPRLCSGTRQMMKNKPLIQDRKKPQHLSPKRLSGKPRITRSAVLRSSRGFNEMWKDGERRELNRKLRQQEIDAAIAATCTFKPIQAPLTRTSGIPSLVSEDNLPLYMRRVRELQEEKRHLAAERKLQQQQREDAECTFQPVTHPLPSYITEMADASMNLRDALCHYLD